MRILVRGGKPPHVPVSPEASLARWGWGIFGANVGNTLFLESVYRAVNVPSAEVSVDSLYVEQTKSPAELAAEINEQFDVYVLPLANAFRANFERSLTKLTQVIEHLTIPVVVPGIGGQSGIGDAMGGLDTATKAFVAAVLDRSASIGVRGERTAQYLRSLGFPESTVDIIGCPSMFDNNGDVVVTKRVERLDEDSAIAINVSPADGAEAFVEWHTEKYKRLIYVPQEHAELAMLLWGDTTPAPSRLLPTHSSHTLYREGRIRFFLDPTTWHEFMRTQDFAFGMRIHGTIAALAAGTPAMLLAHDSRTLELAEYHRIPYRAIGADLPVVDAADAYGSVDFAELNAFRHEAKDRYIAFWRRNGVPTIHDPGQANPSYEDDLHQVDFPAGIGPIASIMSPTERELLRKLNWLRQGNSVDAGRWVGGYMPNWKPKAR